MTSEEILGFPEPPGHQCSNIDSFIKVADGIAKDIAMACKSDSLEDMYDHCRDADWNAGDIEGYFEELRTALEDLRNWGQDWKDLAKSLADEHEPDLIIRSGE